MAERFSTIDDYISSFPRDVQILLEQIRRTIRRVAPDADETISYHMPTFALDGRSLVHFAAWKHHISLYPIPDVDEALARELAPYVAGKGTVTFPLDEPIPYGLIERLVTLLVAQRAGSA